MALSSGGLWPFSWYPVFILIASEPSLGPDMAMAAGEQARWRVRVDRCRVSERLDRLDKVPDALDVYPFLEKKPTPTASSKLDTEEAKRRVVLPWMAMANQGAVSTPG
ncbi:hypothetical protein B0T24DRAFT_587551 [Lasiosphaeria ovina]|uniref:Uncharacterized protein n=1 Tax=Lasiosphaeria ovina TaxID=92902 RepID=A0AAE0NJT6_9PEZI|nr:hypothetical protein B0T24DRAFT_587551 [Lasiosphaeria ovina]